MCYHYIAIDETLAYITGHLISPKTPVQPLPDKFVNKTRNFSHHFYFFSYKYQFIEVYRTAPKYFKANLIFQNNFLKNDILL